MKIKVGSFAKRVRGGERWLKRGRVYIVTDIKGHSKQIEVAGFEGKWFMLNYFKITPSCGEEGFVEVLE